MMLANGLQAVESLSRDFQFNVEVLSDDARIELKAVQGQADAEANAVGRVGGSELGTQLTPRPHGRDAALCLTPPETDPRSCP
jgi:hypothetical protein